jgi:glucose-1-phosphate cytidylyltransferase
MPILVHVMKIFAHYGFNKFVLCLGYKGDSIKQYFMNHEFMSRDFKVTPGGKVELVGPPSDLHSLEITFAETGLETQTGGRLKKIERYVRTEDFLATYCDGLADVNLPQLLKHHASMNKVGTLTAVHPMSPFGILEEANGVAISFKEKPMLPGLINGGFFVFKRRFFDYLDEDSVLEEEPLRKLTSERQLAVYRHDGFWACMDTFKDFERLNELWARHRMPHTGFRGTPPWAVWQ